MKNKIITYAVVGTAFLFLWNTNRLQKKEIKRLESNQTVLFDGFSEMRNEFGQSQASVGQLVLTAGELLKYNRSLAIDVKNFGLSLKRVESISSTSTENKTQFEAIWGDTVFIDTGRIDTVRCVRYEDAWNIFFGCDIDGKFVADLRNRDTLMQVVHREPKRWWIFRWGTKGFRQEIVCKNPNSTITYSEYVKLK